MGRRRTFVSNLEIDVAQRAHNCQANRAHRITAGTSRLKVKEGRSEEHYCISCAVVSVEADLKRLQALLANLRDAAVGSGSRNHR